MSAGDTAAPDRVPEELETVIIGAGPAGLAAGACLRRADLPFVILEQADRVASSWHNHYTRLHLHTVKELSALPYLPFPDEYPRYPSRQQIVDYLQMYARVHHLEPRFGQRVTAARYRDQRWQLTTATRQLRARRLVVSAGYNAQPKIPDWPGRDQFHGQVLHSSEYRSGAAFRGQRVLVVGLGNSGGEIAIDLWEQGARPTIAVRSPIHVVPRDILGVPCQVSALMMSRLPMTVADRISMWMSKTVVGDLSPYGLRRPEIGPIEQVVKHGRVPLVDVGTVDLIRQGAIQVAPDLERYTADGVAFTDGSQGRFEAVVLATGFRPRLDQWLEPAIEVTDERGYPRWHGEEAPIPGLYFIGYRNPITGAFHDIALEAQRVARDIARKSQRGGASV